MSIPHQPGQRLFFALWPPAGLSQEIQRLGQRVQGHGGRAHQLADLHMTLVFLGPVKAEQLPCIEQAAAAIRAESFTLTLDQIDFWPRPRILLLGGSETPAPLAGLVSNLQAGLRPCGFKPERRPFKPHVTLARKARSVAASVLESPLQWPVDEFVLAGSSLGREGGRYQVLKRWGLATSGS
jgi:2'-5' RNA ligase